MGTDPDKAVFEPAKIHQLDLDRPVTRNQRVMPDAEIKRLREERLDLENSWRVFSPRQKRRLKLYTIGGAVVLPILFVLLMPGVAFSIWRVPLCALFGLYIGFTRPMRSHAVLALFVLAGLILATSGERAHFNLFQIFFGILGILGIGTWIGIAEESKLSM